MVEKLGIEPGKIPDLCNLLYKNYGTTMAGLRVCLYLLYCWYSKEEKWTLFCIRFWSITEIGFVFVRQLAIILTMMNIIGKDFSFFIVSSIDMMKYFWVTEPLIYYNFGSFVHGRLPYENLKPDPVLRNLLLSLPYRKIVSPPYIMPWLHLIAVGVCNWLVC